MQEKSVVFALLLQENSFVPKAVLKAVKIHCSLLVCGLCAESGVHRCLPLSTLLNLSTLVSLISKYNL